MTQQKVAGPSMPRDTNAEKGLLGSILLAPDKVIEESPWLTPKHFVDPTHGKIFGRVKAMRATGIPIDLITLTNQLDANSELLDVGGAAYVTELFTFVPTAANSKYYAEIMAHKAALRGIIAAGTSMVERAYADDSTPPEELIEAMESELVKLRSDTSYTQALTPIKEPLAEVRASLTEAYKHRGRTVGIETGINSLDRMTGGLKAGQFVVIAARPSDGKTSLATQLAVHIAQLKKTVAIFSLEMSKVELVERMVCMEAPLDIGDVRFGFFKKGWEVLVDDAVILLDHLPIFIDETPALSILDFRARARRAVLKSKAEVIILDYLQLMGSTSRQAKDSRQNEIAEVSRAIKATAKELKIPIIVCAQLSREADQRSTPRMSDLRESGQIEQDADIITLLHHPNKYLKDKTDEEQKDVRLIVAKHRNGPKGEVKLLFEKEFARFINVDKKLFSNKEEERQVIERGDGNGDES